MAAAVLLDSYLAILYASRASSELDTLANSEPFGGIGFRTPLTDFFMPANLSLTKSKA